MSEVRLRSRTMETIFENAYLKFLPDEILISILKLLPFEDLMHFCEAFENSDYLLKIKTLINKIDPQQFIGLDLKRFVAKIDPLFVTNVNLNGYHWIPAGQLRSFVERLTNLDKLTVLWTKLSLSDDDLKAYNKTKITKLGVTLANPFKLNGKSIIPTLNTLCLDVESTEQNNAQFIFETPDFVRVFPSLEKLWLEYRGTSIRLQQSPWWSSGLKKLFVNGQLCRNFELITMPNSVFNFYRGQKRKQNVALCLEHFDRPLLPKIEIPNAVWRNCLKIVKCEIPWGAKDARRLYTGEKDLETIDFEELNCIHTCRERDKERLAYKEILRLPNTFSVKKLSVTNCLISTPYYESKIDYYNKKFWSVFWTAGANKEIITIFNNLFENAIVEDGCVLSNFKEVTHLELFVCKNNWGISNCRVIAQFNNLTSLYVQIPLKNNGQFMIEVAMNCKLLGKLTIICKGEYYAHDEGPVFNDEINGNIAKALPHCTSMKEFTFYNFDLGIDELLSALKTVKLRKLVLMCDSPSLTKTCLENYFEENPQLLYCLFKLDCLNGGGSKRRIAEKTFRKYRKHDYNVFLVTGDYDSGCSEPESSPDEDDTDRSSNSGIEEFLCEFRSSICNLVLEEGFENF